MEMNIALALQHLFPEKKQPDDYYVFEVDGVPEIIKWNMEVPQPTEEELQTAWNDYLANLPAEPLTIEQQLEEERVARKRVEARLEGLNNDLLGFMEFQLTGGN
jgi:XkdW protein